MIRPLTIALCLIPAAAALGATTAPGGDAEVERLAWLAGCWERRSGDRVLEEQWMAPRGGTMLGMSRLVRGEETLSHEAIRIHERDGALVYAAAPAGQPPAEFTATSIADAAVVFENPAHDFPQRIIYRHIDGDSLHARIEGERAGVASGVDFRMARVACAG